MDESPEVTEVAVRIISSLDSNGYLMISLEDLLPADSTEEICESRYKHWTPFKEWIRRASELATCVNVCCCN